VEHILAGGVHGLFILGTSGEAPDLSYRLRREVVDRVCRQVKHRVPVLVGITDTSLVEAANFAGYAADAGADAVVSAPPYYFAAGQPELVNFVEELVQKLALPLYLYNMPQMTKVQFEAETLRRVSHLERIAGLKDSSGNLKYFGELVDLKRERPDWTVLVGPEHLLCDAMLRGGDGGVNGGANIIPELFVTLFDALTRGDVLRVAQLQEQVLKLGEIYSVGQHASAVVKGMKCACSLLRICSDRMAAPFEAFKTSEREKVKTVLRTLNLQV
jgi:4-hydroxy-tetrahydrodipicolinate synthase